MPQWKQAMGGVTSAELADREHEPFETPFVLPFCCVRSLYGFATSRLQLIGGSVAFGDGNSMDGCCLADWASLVRVCARAPCALLNSS